MATVFGSLPSYRVLLGDDPPCTKSFLIDYSNSASERTATLQPVGGDGTYIPMVEYIKWDLPTDGSQIELRYDDTVPYTDPKEMLQCKMDPRANPSLLGPVGGDESSTADLLLASGVTPDQVLPDTPAGYEGRDGNVTSCWILTLSKDGEYVAYVYSSIDGFRSGT